jgi:hypothetical protein
VKVFTFGLIDQWTVTISFTIKLQGMKSTKNQTSEKDVNVRFVASSMKGIKQEMQVKDNYEAAAFMQYGKEQDLIVRRYSFDDNGGGYAGL